MDFGTVLGIILGLGLIGVSISTGGGLPFFFDPIAILITFGGTLAACLISYPFAVTRALPRMIGKAFRGRTPSSQDTIERVVRYAELSRRDGMIALEEQIEKEPDPQVKKALRLAVDGTDPKILSLVLRLEVRALEERHLAGQNLLVSAAGYAPAFGMVGTLIGLIQMLLFLNDPTKIGKGMAVALVTTFWGALLSNLVFNPLAGKLRNRTREEKAVRRLVIEGITAIQEGDSPRIVREKLHAFLAPEAQLQQAHTSRD
ncbi:MAG TPA: motility protein A [bacterium]|nr:motility protein A [bacterium]